jgi:hypothetical protein
MEGERQEIEQLAEIDEILLDEVEDLADEVHSLEHPAPGPVTSVTIISTPIV